MGYVSTASTDHCVCAQCHCDTAWPLHCDGCGILRAGSIRVGYKRRHTQCSTDGWVLIRVLPHHMRGSAHRVRRRRKSQTWPSGPTALSSRTSLNPTGSRAHSAACCVHGMARRTRTRVRAAVRCVWTVRIAAECCSCMRLTVATVWCADTAVIPAHNSTCADDQP